MEPFGVLDRDSSGKVYETEMRAVLEGPFTMGLSRTQLTSNTLERICWKSWTSIATEDSPRPSCLSLFLASTCGMRKPTRHCRSRRFPNSSRWVSREASLIVPASRTPRSWELRQTLDSVIRPGVVPRNGPQQRSRLGRIRMHRDERAVRSLDLESNCQFDSAEAVTNHLCGSAM
jgi:hypothetical protein